MGGTRTLPLKLICRLCAQADPACLLKVTQLRSFERGPVMLPGWVRHSGVGDIEIETGQGYERIKPAPGGGAKVGDYGAATMVL